MTLSPIWLAAACIAMMIFAWNANSAGRPEPAYMKYVTEENRKTCQEYSVRRRHEAPSLMFGRGMADLLALEQCVEHVQPDAFKHIEK
jgi:hypothetical protein